MNTNERINHIAKFKKIDSYLEIGVYYGSTFNQLNFKNKIGVDPDFQFNVQDFESQNVQLHSITSDHFFSSGTARNNIFDLVFIDGLHEFKQTLRDFANALIFSHEKTILIIDDVYPSDVFSTLDSDVVKFRRLNNPNNESQEWQGDVFKTIFAIHDLYPSISFVTIDEGYGNPQTLCFKKPRLNFKPAFSSLEEIERLSYFDFIRKKGLLNLLSEDEALKTVTDFLSS